MNTTEAISRLSPGALLLLVVLLLGLVLVEIYYILALRRTLQKCSPASRTMDPGMVWLLIVPFVAQVWNFFVVLNIAKSLGNEFRLRGIPNAEPEPGKMIGLAMSVCGVVALMPKLFPSLAAVTIPAALVHLVLLVYYWTKINGFSRMLDTAPVAMAGYPMAGYPPVAGPPVWPQGYAPGVAPQGYAPQGYAQGGAPQSPGPGVGPQGPPPEGWPQR